MRSGSLGFMTSQSNYSYFNTHSGSASTDAASALLSRKNASEKSSAKERSRLVKDLDKRSQTVSVHSINADGLSAEELHKKLVNIKRTQNTFKSTAADKADGFLKLTQAKSKNELDEALKKHFKYNYRDISTMIRQAKTSASAGLAVTKAKRKVLELRRKIASSTDSDEKAEISAAINHAKSMERVAKKKKRHLETEELVESTMKQDEKEQELSGKDATGTLSSSTMDGLVSQAEDVVDDAYEKLDEMEAQTIEDYFGASDISGISFDDLEEIPTDDLEDIPIDDFDDMMEDFDEAYEMLDEVMENLEMLEVVDPHMDEEDFKALKIRHRQSEEKDMTKADNDYLKAMFDKYQQDMAKAKAAAAYGFWASNPTPVSAQCSLSSVGLFDSVIDTSVSA